MNKKREPTPKSFSSYEEAAAFWETHDTTDYLSEFRTVDTSSELRTRHFEIEIEEDVMQKLQAVAKQRGLPLSQLTSELLRRQLKAA